MMEPVFAMAGYSNDCSHWQFLADTALKPLEPSEVCGSPAEKFPLVAVFQQQPDTTAIDFSKGFYQYALAR